MFGYKKLSLNRKIMMIAVAAIVPMICLVCYLLWTISYTTGVYADITNNVAEANEYVRDFKERYFILIWEHRQITHDIAILNHCQ